MLRVCLIFIFIFSAFGKPKNSKDMLRRLAMEKKTDQAIYRLILEEERSIYAVRKQSNSLKYRFFELQHEKLKYYAKQENKKFIKSVNAKRDKFFKKTKKQYFYLKKLAYDIKKSKRAKPFIPATFLALSMSARDYKFEDRELTYLRIAKRNAKIPSPVNYLIDIATAEYYYNKKKYKTAYRLYRHIVKNKSDQWHTKHLYNYAWTQFKTHKFDQSINNLEKAFKLSFDEKYINFSEQIMNSLIIFYITHKQIQRAIDFIETNEKKPYSSLLKLAQKASKKGFYKETNQVIKLLYTKDMNNEQLVDLKIFEMQHYRHFYKQELFYKTVRSLASLKMAKELYEEVTHLLTEEVRDLQQLLKKDFDVENGRYRKYALDYALFYFERLRFYDEKKIVQYYFYAAETLYSVKEYKRSIPFYKKSITKKDEFKTNRQAIEALYVAVEDAGLAKDKYEKDLEYIYLKVIELWPREKSTIAVYEKLFYLYLKQKKHKRMSFALNKFTRGFPKLGEKHRALFELQIDLYIKQKDTNSLSNIVKRIKKKYLHFSKKRIVQIEDILANLLFNTYKSLREDGNDKDALKGYQDVYVNDNYPRKIRAQAAFNSAIIYVDLADSNNTIKWIQKTRRMDRKIYEHHKKDIVMLADRTLLKQDFNGASKLYSSHLSINCKEKKANLPIFRNLLGANMAKSYSRKTLHFFKKYSHCVEKEKTAEMVEEIISYFVDQNEYKNLVSFAKKHKYDDKKLFPLLEELYWKNGQDSFLRRSISRINTDASKGFLSTRSEYLNFQTQTRRTKKQDISFPEKMTPEKFNEKLNSFFTNVSSVVAQSDKILGMKNSGFSLLTLTELQAFLKVVSDKISAIKSPIKDKNFNKQFSAQMNSLAKNFADQVNVYKRTLEKFRHKYKVTIRIDKEAKRLPASVKTIDLE